MPTAVKKYLTERQAADILGYSPTTIRQSRWTGKLSGQTAPRAVKFGRTVRYEAQELERWANAAAGAGGES